MGPLLLTNLRPLLRTPHKFLTSRTTRLLFTVYLGTYASANILDSIQMLVPAEAYAPASPAAVKLLGVSAVSTSLTIFKDSCLAQMFGAGAKRSVPSTSYLLFTLRDIVTIHACFVLPPVVASRLDDVPTIVKDALSLNTLEARSRASQLLLPVLVQSVSTPIHLLALDLYNRQSRLALSTRLARVRRDLPLAVPTRMLRIIPAFGIGGLINTGMRRALLGTFGFKNGQTTLS